MRIKNCFKYAKENNFAIGHFNFATEEQLKAIVEGFRNLSKQYELSPEKYCLMVGTSEGEAEFFGYKQARAVVDAWKEETGLTIFLNADHHKSFETTKKAMDSGYDTVLIDCSKMTLEENILITKQVVEYASQISPDLMVEGELGYLKGESKVYESVEISPSDLTRPEEALEFVHQTGVERLAVAIGNFHGITTKQKPELDFVLLEQIVSVLPSTYLVLHGGSGLSDDNFKRAIAMGVTNVHINTEVRIAYHDAIDQQVKKEDAGREHETTPYKFFLPSVEGMREVVENRLKIFMSLTL